MDKSEPHIKQFVIDNLIEICPNLISLIIVDIGFKWNFSKLSQLKQLKTLGMVYNDVDWEFNSGNANIPFQLYQQIQSNAFPQLSNFIIHMFSIPYDFTNPPNIRTIRKYNNNDNSMDNNTSSDIIR